ncbi:hypothetical protein Acr_13g0017130 [Actinidia rufa]|uniref:NmrA-like domain-containing protein n=1 Tax=Actinidia rufa TaxID=165716 RepID=A0A7J0FP02_9ERIC|nr:hypothetical protein Acr_13g0017130 [Actinidia rufa]
MTVSHPVDAAKGRVLIVGATGFIGQFVAEASLGVIDDQEFMEKILKENEIDIVISAVGGGNILNQLTLVRAIKSCRNNQVWARRGQGRSGGARADHVYNEKRRVRRLIEDSGVHYTYICCNSIASWPYYDNTHPSEVIPPLDKFQIYGDGSVKAYFVAGSDIGKFTIKTVDDIRTLNKSVHFRPTCNFLNINELASLWEKKIGRILPRVTVTEDDLLAAAEENIIPQSIVASFTHDIFIKGCQVNFSIDGPNEVEASCLYPDESFRTVDECFNDYVMKIEDKRAEATADGITAQINVKCAPIRVQ